MSEHNATHGLAFCCACSPNYFGLLSPAKKKRTCVVRCRSECTAQYFSAFNCRTNYRTHQMYDSVIVPTARETKNIAKHSARESRTHVRFAAELCQQIMCMNGPYTRKQLHRVPRREVIASSACVRQYVDYVVRTICDATKNTTAITIATVRMTCLQILYSVPIQRN